MPAATACNPPAGSCQAAVEGARNSQRLFWLAQDEKQALAECVQTALTDVQAKATKASAEAAGEGSGGGGAPDQVDVEAVLQAQLEERRNAEVRTPTCLMRQHA